jgi:hypothetical protein
VTAALARVATLRVPDSVSRHRYVREAFLTASALDKSLERVIGTTNDSEVRTELYGWAKNVDPHKDCTGFVYFSPIFMPDGESIAHAGDISEEIALGGVYRLDDFVEQWTEDAGPVVCMFRGPYRQVPEDADAVGAFRSGIAALARRSLYAPRVKPGFRFPQRGECYADTPTGTRIVRLAEARRRNWMIATCSETGCSEIAFEVDHHFPYFWDGNACLQHKAKAAGL